MALPLYSDYHHAYRYYLANEWRDHLDYLVSKGYTGVVMMAGTAFENPTNGVGTRWGGTVTPVTNTGGSSFTLNPTWANYVRARIDDCAARGLRVGLITQGSGPTWSAQATINTSNSGYLRSANAYNFGQQLGQYYGDSTAIEFWIHGWDDNRSSSSTNEDQIWSLVTQGLKDYGGVATTKDVTYHCANGTGVNEAGKLANSSWLDFHFIQSGHGSDIRQDWWWNNVLSAGILGNTGKDIVVGEVNYANLGGDGSWPYPPPTVVELGDDAQAYLDKCPVGRQRLYNFGDWMRITWCNSAEGLKPVGGIYDADYYGGVTTTEQPGPHSHPTYNAIGNDGEAEVITHLGINPGGGGPTITINPGDSIQTAVNDVDNNGTVLLNEGIYQNQSVSMPAGKTVYMRPATAGNRWWDDTAGTGVLISGGSVVSGPWTAGSGGWWADISSFGITQWQADPSKNYNIRARDRDRMVVTVGNGWATQVDSTGNLGDTLREGATYNYHIQYGADSLAERLYLDHNPTDTVIIGRQETVITGSGTLHLEDLTVGHARPNFQWPIIRVYGNNSTFDRVELWASSAGALKVAADGVTFQNGWIHHMGMIGVHNDLTGSSTTADRNNGVHNVNNFTWLNTRIEYANINFYIWGDEGGGAKVAWTDNFRGEHLHFRYIFGPAAWTDINNYNSIWRHCLIEDTHGPGIYHEVSFKALIEYNKIVRAGAWPSRTPGIVFPQHDGGVYHHVTPGIVWADSNPLFDRSSSKGGGLGGRGTIRHNHVEDCRGGIFFRQINRDGDFSVPTVGGSDPYRVKAVDVYNNDVWVDGTMDTGDGHAPWHGFGQDYTPEGYLRNLSGASEITMENTDFTINGTYSEPTANIFALNGSQTNLATWRGTYGYDTTSTGAQSPPEEYGITAGNPLYGPVGGTVQDDLQFTWDVNEPLTAEKPLQMAFNVNSSVIQSTDGYYIFDGGAANYFYSPDSAQLNISGNKLSLVALIEPDIWRPTAYQVLIGKFKWNTADKEFRLSLSNLGTGNLEIQVSENGTANHHVGKYDPAFTNNSDKKWIRGDFDTGAGLGEIFWSDDGVAWNSLGTGSFPAFTGVHDGTGTIELGNVGGGVGSDPYSGKFFYAEVWDGDYGTGTRIANPDFRTTSQRVTNTLWTDDHGNNWTMNGTLAYVEGTVQASVVPNLTVIDSGILSNTDGKAYTPRYQLQPQFVTNGEQLYLVATVFKSSDIINPTVPKLVGQFHEKYGLDWNLLSFRLHDSLRFLQAVWTAPAPLGAELKGQFVVQWGFLGDVTHYALLNGENIAYEATPKEFLGEGTGTDLSVALTAWNDPTNAVLSVVSANQYPITGDAGYQPLAQPGLNAWTLVQFKEDEDVDLVATASVASPADYVHYVAELPNAGLTVYSDATFQYHTKTDPAFTATILGDGSGVPSGGSSPYTSGFSAAFGVLGDAVTIQSFDFSDQSSYVFAVIAERAHRNATLPPSITFGTVDFSLAFVENINTLGPSGENYRLNMYIFEAVAPTTQTVSGSMSFGEETVSFAWSMMELTSTALGTVSGDAFDIAFNTSFDYGTGPPQVLGHVTLLNSEVVNTSGDYIDVDYTHLGSGNGELLFVVTPNATEAFTVASPFTMGGPYTWGGHSWTAAYNEYDTDFFELSIDSPPTSSGWFRGIAIEVAQTQSFSVFGELEILWDTKETLITPVITNYAWTDFEYWQRGAVSVSSPFTTGFAFEFLNRNDLLPPFIIGYDLGFLPEVNYTAEPEEAYSSAYSSAYTAGVGSPTAARNMQTSWSIAGPIEDDLNVTWEVKQLLEVDIETTFNVGAGALNDVITRWNVESIGFKDLSIRWNVDDATPTGYTDTYYDVYYP